MTTITLNAIVARETEKAVALVIRGEHRGEAVKPLYMPRSKGSVTETDESSIRVCLAGEKIARQGVPVTVEIDAEFLAKVRPDLLATA